MKIRKRRNRIENRFCVTDYRREKMSASHVSTNKIGGMCSWTRDTCQATARAMSRMTAEETQIQRDGDACHLQSLQTRGSIRPDPQPVGPNQPAKPQTWTDPNWSDWPDCRVSSHAWYSCVLLASKSPPDAWGHVVSACKTHFYLFDFWLLFVPIPILTIILCE